MIKLLDKYEQYSLICHILHPNFVSQILYVKIAYFEITLLKFIFHYQIMFHDL